VFIALGVVSEKSWKIVISRHKGVFVKTPMEGELILMKIDPKMMNYIIELYQIFRSRMGEDGCLYMILLKAIHQRNKKCMSKRPVEAVLIGFSDNLGLIELFQELQRFWYTSHIPRQQHDSEIGHERGRCNKDKAS
jgi:hypothetical protein